jgi:hypothetical protein
LPLADKLCAIRQRLYSYIHQADKLLALHKPIVFSSNYSAWSTKALSCGREPSPTKMRSDRDTTRLLKYSE